MKCRHIGDAPCGMTRGSATTDRQFMYFTSWNSTSLYRYKWSADSWEKLPQCQFYNSTLVIIHRALTAVGGVKDNKPIKELFTLQHDDNEWKEIHSPMKTARSCPAVASHKDFIVVIAGDVGGNNQTTKVELLQVESKMWYEVANLPQPVKFPSATILGSWVHVIGNDGCGFSCSLKYLPYSEPIEQESLSWKVLPQLPVEHATAASLNGALVIVGGQLKENKTTVNSIYQLVKGGEWVNMCTMTCERFDCLVVAPSPNSLMIVGGFGESTFHTLNVVEECF